VRTVSANSACHVAAIIATRAGGSAFAQTIDCVP